jgi:hypothetical protein
METIKQEHQAKIVISYDKTQVVNAYDLEKKHRDYLKEFPEGREEYLQNFLKNAVNECAISTFNTYLRRYEAISDAPISLSLQSGRAELSIESAIYRISKDFENAIQNVNDFQKAMAELGLKVEVDITK